MRRSVENSSALHRLARKGSVLVPLIGAFTDRASQSWRDSLLIARGDCRAEIDYCHFFELANDLYFIGKNYL